MITRIKWYLRIYLVKNFLIAFKYLQGKMYFIFQETILNSVFSGDWSIIHGRPCLRMMTFSNWSLIDMGLQILTIFTRNSNQPIIIFMRNKTNLLYFQIWKQNLISLLINYNICSWQWENLLSNKFNIINQRIRKA